jgi:nitrogen regulatory protein P-II 1
MKEVKAYIRAAKVEEVIRALEVSGVSDMTVIDVMAIGSIQADPKNSKFSIELMERYAKIAKLEIVCKDESMNSIVSIIVRTAFTGQPGDGIVYVTPVETAVKILAGFIDDHN